MLFGCRFTIEWWTWTSGVGITRSVGPCHPWTPSVSLDPVTRKTMESVTVRNNVTVTCPPPRSTRLLSARRPGCTMAATCAHRMRCIWTQASYKPGKHRVSTTNKYAKIWFAIIFLIQDFHIALILITLLEKTSLDIFKYNISLKTSNFQLFYGEISDTRTSKYGNLCTFWFHKYHLCACFRELCSNVMSKWMIVLNSWRKTISQRVLTSL